MGFIDVTFWIAFSAGFASFLSPCVLPLIPAYIMYITGTSIENELNKKKLFALTRTIGFIIGFTIIFMLLGASASFLGSLLVKNKVLFSKISGIIIIVLGLNLTGIIKIRSLYTEKRVEFPKKIYSWFGAMLMGMAFAAGWTPCFGPVLASILLYAGVAATASKGIYLLFVYSMGMAIPFILTSIFINAFSKLLLKSGKIISYISKVSGVLLVAFGILIYFDKFSYISNLFI